MAEYTPTVWECGDVVTAERLNHMEEGIADAIECCGGGGGMLLEVVDTRATTAEECAEEGTVDIYNHTWQEVYDAVHQGILPIMCQDEYVLFLVAVYLDPVEADYVAMFNGVDQIGLHSATTTAPLQMLHCNQK